MGWLLKGLSIMSPNSIAKQNYEIDFNKFVSSVSLALDLAEGCAFRDKKISMDFDHSIPGFSVYAHNFSSHSKKTALIANSIASRLNFSSKKTNNLYVASFLHDIGAVDAFNASHSDKSFIYEHSEFGGSILKKLPIDPNISLFIKYHHENYDGSGPNGISGSDIPEESAVIHVADVFELLYNETVPNRLQRSKILDWIKSKSKTIFDPRIVEALLEAASVERFWLDIENINTDPDVLKRIHPKLYTPSSLNTLMDIAKVFAAIIDKKSSYTHEHSVGLSKLADKFSSFYGFDKDKTSMFKISALLHDLGKLAVPNEILDKPGPLTKEEFTIIKSHTYYTKLILSKIKGLEEVSEWAANHHETLKGTGYPEGICEDGLSKECRIMAVCDIYQALTEDRPYRKGLSKERALAIMDDMVENGSIDSHIVKDLKEIV